MTTCKKVAGVLLWRLKTVFMKLWMYVEGVEVRALPYLGRGGRGRLGGGPGQGGSCDGRC
jgi:hypothetical protein